MTYTLEQFCDETRDTLKADQGDDGREQIRRNLGKLLADEAFVAARCEGYDAWQGAILERTVEEYAAAAALDPDELRAAPGTAGRPPAPKTMKA